VIDTLIIIEDTDPKRAYLEIALALEDELGDKAYIIKVHVIDRKMIDESSLKQLLGGVKRIYEGNLS